MSFVSVAFAGFCGLAVIVLNLIKNPGWRAALVLLFNLAFIASFIPTPAQAVPLALFVLAGYAAILLARHVNGAGFSLLVAALIISFIWIKGYAFASFLPRPALTWSTIGLSYILFRIVHLLIDVHQRVLPPPRPVIFLAYIFFFLALVQGPIQRFEDFEVQLAQPQLPRDTAAADHAFRRILHGLFLVAVACQLTSYLFSHLEARVLIALPGPNIGASLVVLFTAAALMFLIHLYLNFVGYMEMVIGIGALCGFTLPENFDKPYLATNFLDLWSRWHITLSNWFKFYLFNPVLKTLAERFRSPAAMPYLSVFAFFATFGVMGLWHGSGWIFLGYGLFLALGASANKLYQIEIAKRLGKKRYKSLTQKSWYLRLSRASTIAYFGLAIVALWVPDGFVSTLLSRKGVVLGACALSGIAGFALGMDLLLTTVARLLPSRAAKSEPTALAPFAMGLQFSLLMVLIAMIDAGSAPEFVYKVF
jgi:D-alanyl-lipoteichoic acid acyltransferase DltB (MBOAT superfamily)